MSLRSGLLERHIYPSLVLVQPRKTRPCLTERLLMGHKESNLTKKQKPNFASSDLYKTTRFRKKAVAAKTRLSTTRAVVSSGFRWRNFDVRLHLYFVHACSDGFGESA